MNQAQTENPAETYERYFVPAMFLPWATLLLGHAAPKPGERILDIACGTGVVARLAAPMAGADGQVVALDINAAMLAVARALPPPGGGLATGELRIRCAAGQFLRDLAGLSKDQKGHGCSCNSGQL